MNPTTRLWFRLAIMALVAICAGVLLYRESLVSLTSSVLHREGSSHGIFVPFLSAFFLWTKRDTLLKTELRYNLFGIPLIAAGFIFPVFIPGPFNLQILGLIIFLAGAVLLLLGRKFFQEVSFPLFFLITLIPIPDETYLRLADWIRIVSFGGSRWIITVLGIPFLREGNIIQFHNSTLEVAIGCSGIRYLVSYFVFSFAYAFLFKENTWSRIAVVLSSIVISLFASVMRLTSIFVLVYYVSPYWGQHKPHVVISWCVFFVVLFAAISLDQHIQKKLAEN